MTDVHEYVVMKFQDGISADEQIETMRQLDSFIAAFEGFKGREYFYSEADNRWIDHIVWASPDAAKASEKLTDDPAAAVLFNKLDGPSMVFGHYARIEAK